MHRALSDEMVYPTPWILILYALYLLQPQNLLLDSYDVLKVSDFGLSQQVVCYLQICSDPEILQKICDQNYPHLPTCITSLALVDQIVT